MRSSFLTAASSNSLRRERGGVPVGLSSDLPPEYSKMGPLARDLQTSIALLPATTGVTVGPDAVGFTIDEPFPPARLVRSRCLGRRWRCLRAARSGRVSSGASPMRRERLAGVAVPRRCRPDGVLAKQERSRRRTRCTDCRWSSPVLKLRADLNFVGGLFDHRSRPLMRRASAWCLPTPVARDGRARAAVRSMSRSRRPHKHLGLRVAPPVRAPAVAL